MLQSLRAYAVEQREESALQEPSMPSWLASLLRCLVYGSWATFFTFITVTPFLSSFDTEPGHRRRVGDRCTAGADGPRSVLGVTFPARGLRPGRATELRLRFWESRPGRWLARALDRGEHKVPPDALVERRTEVAIGLAVDQLFAALPKPLRAQLHELPAVAEQLESHARTVRARLDELNLLIASATPAESTTALHGSTPAAEQVHAERDAVTGDLRQARDRAQERLAETVAALETIRLDLLRLQGGVGDVGRLTTAIHQAQRLGDDVERLLASRESLKWGAAPGGRRPAHPGLTDVATLFLVAAVLGGSVLILQLVLSVIGMEMGHDVDHGGAGGRFRARVAATPTRPTGCSSSPCAASRRAIAFFGIAGRSVLALDLGVVLATLTGVAAGLAAATAVAAAMRQLRNLESDGVVRIEGAVGRSGQVHVRVPADAGAGAGRILLTLQNRLVELPAVSLDGELPSGTPVTVVGLSDPETVEVVRTPDPGD